MQQNNDNAPIHHFGVSLEDLREHFHGTGGTRQAKLFQDIGILDHKFLHGGFHVIVRHQGQTTHLCGRIGTLEFRIIGVAIIQALGRIGLTAAAGAGGYDALGERQVKQFSIFLDAQETTVGVQTTEEFLTKHFVIFERQFGRLYQKVTAQGFLARFFRTDFGALNVMLSWLL